MLFSHHQKGETLIRRCITELGFGYVIVNASIGLESEEKMVVELEVCDIAGFYLNTVFYFECILNMQHG